MAQVLAQLKTCRLQKQSFSTLTPHIYVIEIVYKYITMVTDKPDNVNHYLCCFLFYWF